MTFRQFAFLNVFRNKRLYAAYFLSSTFTVMVFFTFANFAFHPELIRLNENVTKGMTVAGGIIYVFSFFYILYSMSAFLQSRKKEFGVLIIQGMSNHQIRRMVFLENMLIGLFATVIGILLGLIFAKVILLVAENVLVLEGHLYFYFPTYALVVTFVSFIILFLCISIFVTFILRTNKLIELIKSKQRGKDEPKASVWLTLLATILLGLGYAIALKVKGIEVVVALFPVVILVIIGTYLLFTQLSVYVIKKLKANKSMFWKQTNMLLFSDLAYRMKDNARSFFMVAIISTVAFSAIGTLVGLNSFLTEGLKKGNPVSFIYPYQTEESHHVKEIEQTFEQYGITYHKADVELAYFKQKDESILITTHEAYNMFANLIGEEEITVKDDQVILVEQSTANMMPIDKEKPREVILQNGEAIKADQSGMAKPDVLPAVYEYYIVGENIYEQLGTPEEKGKVVGWNVVEGKEDDIIKAGEILSNQYPGITAVDYFTYDISKMWSPVLFVGLFIGIVFFVSAGSFLYFRLYTDLDDDKVKFLSVSKIGLSVKEMQKIITKQMILLFFAPIVVAVIHGAVALTALSNMFNYNLVIESALVLGSFIVIQVIYFSIVRYFYMKQVKLAVYR